MSGERDPKKFAFRFERIQQLFAKSLEVGSPNFVALQSHNPGSSELEARIVKFGSKSRDWTAEEWHHDLLPFREYSTTANCAKRDLLPYEERLATGARGGPTARAPRTRLQATPGLPAVVAQ